MMNTTFTFKKNYALGVKNLDESVLFYQKAFGLYMISLNSEQTEVVLENESDHMHLMLTESTSVEPEQLDVVASQVSESLAWHEDLGAEIKTYPQEAYYVMSDPNGHKIFVQAEIESVVIHNDSKVPNFEDESLDDLGEN